MYEGQLVADETVSNHLLEIEGEEEIEEFAQCPLFLLDTTGCNMYESLDAENGSKYNKGEASLVIHFVQKLSKLMPLDQIGIVTPYNAQVKTIHKYLKHVSEELDSKIEISTVDGF